MEMKTIWTDTVNKECPLPEYPRPQLERENWMNLNGCFEYCIEDKTVKWATRYHSKILVPFAIESMLSEVQRPLYPAERLWYRKKFTLPAKMSGKNILLHFGAVDWQCKVYINGVLAGKHSGGYCAFSLDITAYLTDGENELVVCVYDPTDEGWQQRGKQVLNTHGFWYTATSGIWQTVWLEAVSDCYVKSIRFTPNIDNRTVKIQTELSDHYQASLMLSLYFQGNKLLEKPILSEELLSIDDFELWSPEAPNLYDIVLTVTRLGEVTDTVKSYFGMRKFHVDKDEKGVMRLFLNNKPYFQRGLLDQGYWCDGGLTPASDEAMIYDITKMKELGFNMLRKHIKVEPLRWYYHCDRLGMLVWQDMVSGGQYIGDFFAGVLPNIGITGVKDDKYKIFKRNEKKWRDDFENELCDMLSLLYNCVSIYAWVPFNEAWGQFDALRIGDKVKAMDSTRIVDHASGWYDQGGGDIKSVHKYILPIPMVKSDTRPYVLTEFGGYSHVVKQHTWDEKKAFGYLMFKSKESLTSAYKRLLEKQVIPKIEKGLSGTVYTQVSDVENEVNGILTYDRRRVKIDETVIKELNAEMQY